MQVFIKHLFKIYLFNLLIIVALHSNRFVGKMEIYKTLCVLNPEIDFCFKDFWKI